MTSVEIRKFVGDFTDALSQISLSRIRDVDIKVRKFGSEFDSVAGYLDWSDANVLARAGIDINWLQSTPNPHRTFMHPDLIYDNQWVYINEYIHVSMVSDKQSRVLFPNLAKSRRPSGVSNEQLLEEAKALNRYLRLVQEAGLSGDRIVAYRGDLKTHGQGQNDSGRIGAVGATVAVVDALNEISPGAIISSYGTLPPTGVNDPASIVKQMSKANYEVPKALLLSSQRAIVFSSDPDIAIVSRIGGNRYASAKEAFEEWATLRRQPSEERNSFMHQAALGEVKTALDPANIHERLALGSRENRDEARATRFLLMAVLTPDILDPQRIGRRAMFSPDAGRFQDIFNLYFVWGYDSARTNHMQHWADFKQAIKRWAAL